MEIPKFQTPGFSDKKSRGYIRTLSPAARKRYKNMTPEQKRNIAEFARKVREDCLQRRKEGEEKKEG